MCSCSKKDLEFTSTFNLTAQREAEITALVGYFDVGFGESPNRVRGKRVVLVVLVQVIGETPNQVK